MGLKQDKVLRLKNYQKTLRSKESSRISLQSQQRALKSGLLIRKPVCEDKMAKVRRLKENQRILKDLALKREKDRKERERLLKKLGVSNTKGVYFRKKK